MMPHVKPDHNITKMFSLPLQETKAISGVLSVRESRIQVYQLRRKIGKTDKMTRRVIKRC